LSEDYYATGHLVEGSSNIVGHDVISGVVSDFGTATTPNANSTIETLHLTKGTVKVNANGFFNSKITHFHKDTTTCSESGDFAAGKVIVLSVTETYKGITGTLIYTGTFEILGTRPAGKCTFNVAKAVAEEFVGSGKVSY
jgi:hypothetical protein